MKITYEIGDIVEIEDNMDAPDDLGASFVKLLELTGYKEWKVEVTEGWGPPSGTIGRISEKWFIHY
jgi:hypothetical protein